MDTTIPKVLQKLKTPKEIISKNNKTGASYYLTLDILQSYNKQNDLYWHLKKTHGQWKRSMNLEMNQYIYGQLIIYTLVRNTQYGKEVCSIHGAVKSKSSNLER